MGHAFGVAISIEKTLSAPFAKIPFPGLPAMRVGDTSIGLPHAHNHPPNLTPPNPVPLPLPGVGQVISIPYVSGASATFIEKAPAARCGDLGLSIFCGGLFPLYELFLGSSSVWIEGARQARGISDISKHCIFSTPRPSDPPIGPMVGMTIAGAVRTKVGGIPMPSMVAMAMGALFKGLFKGVGGAIKKLRPPAVNAVTLERFLNHASLHGDDAFKKAVKKDLARMARTAEGRSIMNRIVDRGHPLEIHAPNEPAVAADFGNYGDHCAPLGNNGHVKLVADPKGPYVTEFTDGSTRPVSITGAGSGEGSRIAYDPGAHPGADHPGSPSDVILAHEMNHAANNAEGNSQSLLKDPDRKWQRDWTNHEEKNTVGAENRYRSQRGGVPQRKDYRALP